MRRVGYVAYALHLWTVFGLFLSNLTGGVALAAGATLRPRVWPHGRAVLIPGAVYAVCVLLSIAVSPDPTRSLGGARELLAVLTLPLGLAFVRGEGRVRSIVDGLVLVGAASALWGLAQLFFGYGGIDQRIRGPFSHWMTFAGVLLIADLLLIAGLASGRRRRAGWRWLALVAINLGLIGCLTRGAWIAGAVAIAVVLALSARRWLAVAVPLLLLLLLLAPTPVRDRVASINDLSNFSNYDRLCMIEAGWRMTTDRPVLGHGPEMVRVRYPIYRHPTAPRHWVPHLHNNLAQIAAETGLPSLAAFVWWMAVPIVLALRGFRRARRERDGAADLYLGALGALVAFNVAGLFEFNWGDTEVQRLALFMMAMPSCLSIGEAA